MLPYLLCFALTLIFAWANEQLLREKCCDARLVVLTAGMVILLPSILAGCRDNFIGTDVYVYAFDVFENAKEYGWDIVINPANYKLDRIEIGYRYCAYVASLVFSSVQGFLFVTCLIICLMVYLSLYILRDTSSIFIGEWIFLFMCYNESYNAMRQYMAMAVILLAVALLLKKKYLLMMLCIALAYTFHHSSLILIFIVAVAYVMMVETSYTQKLTFWKNTGTRLLFFTAICAIISIYFKEISTLLVSYGILPDKYLSYLKYSVDVAHAKISINGILAYASCYIFLALRGSHIKYAGPCLAFAICDLSFYNLRTYIFWLYRISTYFLILRIISFSSFRLDWERILKEHKLSYEDLMTVGVLLSAFIYWFYFFIHRGANETYPYFSKLLGII